jgi:riboflavin kinase/FMN adenylyltransferase
VSTPAQALCQELTEAQPGRPVAATFGVFDGVHRGHQHLLARLRDAAARRELAPVAITLTNHPLLVLRPQAPVLLIESMNERLRRLRAEGVPTVIPLSFTRELARMPAEEFMRAMVECLGLRHFVVGPDFALGRDREGNVETLARLGERLGYTVEVVEPYLLDGRPVRSTAVRRALAEGDLATAERFLGRRFSLDAPVVEGEGRGGGLLGFPTANLGLGPLQALPADGVYACWLEADGVRYPAATSVGTKPTFHEDGPRVVEAFVLDFDGNLYGEQVRLEFVERLRGQERYDTVDALVAQIRADVADTRAALGAPARAGGQSDEPRGGAD